MFIIVKEGAVLPVRATEHAAAYDLAAYDHATIAPGRTAIIDTGIAYKLDDPSQCGLVLSRSGLAAKKSVFVLNAPGLLDFDYTDTIKVMLHNAGTEPFVVNPGDRVAQFLLTSYQTFGDIATTKRTGGLGSTGVERFPQEKSERDSSGYPTPVPGLSSEAIGVAPPTAAFLVKELPDHLPSRTVH